MTRSALENTFWTFESGNLPITRDIFYKETNMDPLDTTPEHETLLASSPPHPKRTSTRPYIITITLLLTTILFQATMLLHQHLTRPPSYSLLGLPTARTHHYPSGLLNTFWQGSNLTAPNIAWSNINPGHGIIKISPAFALQHNLPPTINHPHDPTKLVYALEAYHMMHCIQVLRKDYLLLKEAQAPSKPLEHAMHCFDALRQSVMCQASDELLRITGKGHSGGVEQIRSCRSWDELRDFAGRYGACYVDEDVPGGDRWSVCESLEGDGLPVGGLLG